MRDWFTKNKTMILRGGGSVLAIVLLILLLEQQGWDDILNAGRQLEPWRLIAALALIMGSRFFVVLRWHVLLRSSGTRVSVWRTMAITFTGLFASNFLPTTIGGDVARLAGAIKMGVDRAIALASLVVDRLIGMAGMALVLPFGLVQLWALPASDVTASAFSPAVFWEKIKGYFRKVLKAMGYWIKQPTALLTSLLFTLGHMACNFFAMVLILRGLNDPLSFWTVAGLSSIAYFIGLMPISINGLGVQELTVTYFYSTVGGLDVNNAVVLALLQRILVTLASLPGVFFMPSVMSDRIELSQEDITIE